MHSYRTNTPEGATIHNTKWLPVWHRIDFKVTMTVFKCIHGLAPQYLADNCVLASTVRSRHLRSTDTMKLLVQRTKTIIGTRAFAVAAATVWNRLPADIRTSTCTVQTFAQKLKTFYDSRRIWGLILRRRNWLIIHADHVVHRRGYCFDFGCMYVCMLAL